MERMVGGYAFISILAVTIPIGFFKPGPLDDITINFNLDESPKVSGYKRDEAHDYESRTEYVVNIANHLDEYIEGVIQLKEDEKIKYFIEPKTKYKTPMRVADNSVLVVDASILGNKSRIQENRFSKGNLTKKIEETIFDSAKNLTQFMKFAAEDLVPPEFQNYMDNLTQEVDTIYQNIGEWMKEEEKILVYEIQTKMVKSHNELFFLRQTLTILAKETIDRSNKIIRLFKKLKQDDQKFNKALLKVNTKKMKNLLKRSFSILRDAIKIYLKIVEDIKLVKKDIQNFAVEIGNMDEEENEALKEYAHWKRVEAYGPASACVIGPILCAITMPVAWKLSEDKIAKETAKFNKLAFAIQEAENNTNRLVDKMDEKSKYVMKELTLIQKWSSDVSMVQDEFSELDFSYFIELEQDKATIDSLCELTKTCKAYIDHHMPGLEDLEIDSPPLDEACLAEGVLYPRVKCKPYNTNGKSVQFYNIVRGQDPAHDCVVEKSTNPKKDRNLRPANQ